MLEYDQGRMYDELGRKYEKGGASSSPMPRPRAAYRPRTSRQRTGIAWRPSRAITGAQVDPGHLLHANGCGVARSDAEALRWYRLSAAQEYAAACNNLGRFHEEGRSVEQSDAEAVRLYRLAAGKDEAVAQCNLARMHEHGRGTPASDAEAVRWYTSAANAGNGLAREALRRLREADTDSRPDEPPEGPPD